MYRLCIQDVDTMFARVRRWGNSLAIRLRKDDVGEVAVSEGDLVKVEIIKVATADASDLSDLPTFKDEDPRASVNHDKYLYG